MKPTLVMHVNYCEQGQPLDDICRKAMDWGFDGVEFRRKRSGIVEEPDRYLDSLAAETERAGLKQVIFGSPGPELMTSDDRLREAELAAALRFYQLASERFSLTVCNTFTGALLNLPATAKQLVDRIGSPAVGITLDYANTILFPNPPPIRDAITLLGKSLFYVHLKNLIVMPDRSHVRASLADGQINNRELLRALKEAGFAGPICIEAPRPGDREWFARQDLAYVKSLLNNFLAVRT